jgi:ABC-type bacteriocin/lantibiotic exporter with double-glycine peptidase domain
LKDPEILIFDEATSSLDRDSENNIKQAIEELRGHKTLIIVSHRPTMLERVDRVFLIHDKKISEMLKEQAACSP